MLGARLATAAVAIPLLLAIIFALPPWGVAILIFVLGSIAVWEYMTMAFPHDAGERRLGVLLGVASLGALCASAAPGAGGAAVTTVGVFVLLVAAVMRPGDMSEQLRDLSIAWLGISYVAILVHFVWLRHLTDGSFWIAFVVANGMASDTGAYFVGRALGRRKLLPRVSPNKTVEGALGNLAAAALVGALAWWLVFPAESLAGLLILATVLAAIGQLGDLAESLIKRACGSKESGSIFPGHGGVLDRIDSLLFPVAVLYYYRLVS